MLGNIRQGVGNSESPSSSYYMQQKNYSSCVSCRTDSDKGTITSYSIEPAKNRARWITGLVRTMEAKGEIESDLPAAAEGLNFWWRRKEGVRSRSVGRSIERSGDGKTSKRRYISLFLSSILFARAAHMMFGKSLTLRGRRKSPAFYSPPLLYRVPPNNGP